MSELGFTPVEQLLFLRDHRDLVKDLTDIAAERGPLSEWDLFEMVESGIPEHIPQAMLRCVLAMALIMLTEALTEARGQ